MLLIVVPGFIRTDQIQRQSCERSNAARQDQIALWTYIINATARPNETPHQRQVIADFKTQLDDIFAPRNCR